MTDSSNEKKFMREKIVKPQETKRRKAGKVFCLVFSAVIFGIVAAVSFVAALPVAKKHLAPETTTQTVPITIEKDDDPGVVAESTEAIEATEPYEEIQQTEAEAAVADEEDIRSIVKDELKEVTWSTDKIREFYQLISEIGADAENSIVTVSAVKQQMDWFDNPVESTGQYAGVILAINETEIVILTGKQAVTDADALRVAFYDGTTAEGIVKQTD